MLLYVNKINKGEPDTASAFLYEGPHLFPSSLSGGLALGCLTCLLFSWCASDLNSDCQAQLAPGRSLETKGVQGICPKSPGSLDTAAREGSAKKIKQVFRAKSAVLPKACSSRASSRGFHQSHLERRLSLTSGTSFCTFFVQSHRHPHKS